MLTQQERKNKAYEVLSALARETLDRSQKGLAAQFMALNLQTAVSPDAAKEPSGWLSPLWTKLVQEESQWQEGLAGTARDLGLQFLPKLRKTPGSPALYWLDAVPLSIADTEKEDDAAAPVPEGGVRYTPAAVRAPGAWLNSALRSGILRWTKTFRLALVATVIATVICAIALIWVGVMIGLQSTRPLTLQEVLFLGVLIGAGWVLVRAFRFVDELFDLRIVLAPSLLTPISEDRVTLELRRARLDDEVGVLAFVRYTATCAQCASPVDIHSGGAAFPGRLIGRCRRSAREHVFSFDPVLRVGRQLN